MNVNAINEIISNEKSRELYINIVVGEKKYAIDTIESDFENGVLKIIVDEEGIYSWLKLRFMEDIHLCLKKKF